MRNLLKYLRLYLLVLIGIYLFVASEAFGQVEILYGTYNSEGEIDSVMYKDRYGNTWMIDGTGMLEIQEWSMPLGGWFPNNWQTYSAIHKAQDEDNSDGISVEAGIIIGFFIGAFGMWILAFFILVYEGKG